MISQNQKYTSSVNYIKNAGISYIDAIYRTAEKTDFSDFSVRVIIYNDSGDAVGEASGRTVISSREESFIFVRIPLTGSGKFTVKSLLMHGNETAAEDTRVITGEVSFADTSHIRLKPNTRLDKSERVGLGYIMGIDLPRLIVPSYEVHNLTLRYEATDDAVINGVKKAGDAAVRYGGWEARGAWKTESDERYTLAGEQMGHWLSAAAVFYNALKNEKSIEVTAASLNGYDTSDTPQPVRNDMTVTPLDLHSKIEYVIDKLTVLQNTEIPKGCTTVLHKEYIGGCDEIPFLNCFRGLDNWCDVYWVPWYNIHKVFQGLLDVYDYAETETAVKAYIILKKLCAWAIEGMSSLTDAQVQKVLETEYGGMNEVFAKMYEITGDCSYLQEAEHFTHKSIIEPLETNNTASLSGKHANTQIPKFIGAARLYEQDRQKYASYRAACENFWNNVNNERCYAIGGNSLNEHFQNEGSEELGVKTCESCNTYNMMRLTEHLFAWEHKSEYMDWYERALYNHILGQQEPESGAKMYFVSLVQGTHRIYEQKYNSWWCCTGTGMENPGRYTRTMYFEDRDDLYINLYIPSTYTWTRRGLNLDIETQYPYEETVRIKVTGSGSGNVKLRAPRWAEKVTVKIRDIVSEAAGGGYVTLKNVVGGDVIELTMPMAVSVYKSRDDSKTAYEYGPLVLAARLDGAVRADYEYIWEERNTACEQTVYPSLITTDGKGKLTGDDIKTYITKTDDGMLSFKLCADRNSMHKDIELVPFTDITHGYHCVYFDLDTEIDEYSINLSALQLDYADPDGQQSELAHGLIQSSENKNPFRANSIQGTDSHGQYRFAYGSSGFFKYNMLADKKADKNYLILRYYDLDDSVNVKLKNNEMKKFSVRFKIFVDDTVICENGNDYIELDVGEGKFTDRIFEIPKSAVEASTRTDASTGLSVVSVKLVSCDDNSCTAVCRRLYTTSGNPNMQG